MLDYIKRLLVSWFGKPAKPKAAWANHYRGTTGTVYRGRAWPTKALALAQVAKKDGVVVPTYIGTFDISTHSLKGSNQ